MRRIEPYFHFQDARGEITGLLRGLEIQEANLVRSVAGTVRGGHFHEATLEAFAILSGALEVTLHDRQGALLQVFTAGPGEIFLIEPGEVHTFRMLEDSAWINFLDHAMDDAAPDIHRP